MGETGERHGEKKEFENQEENFFFVHWEGVKMLIVVVVVVVVHGPSC